MKNDTEVTVMVRNKKIDTIRTWEVTRVCLVDGVQRIKDKMMTDFGLRVLMIVWGLIFIICFYIDAVLR